jgi:hypothetical protein
MKVLDDDDDDEMPAPGKRPARASTRWSTTTNHATKNRRISGRHRSARARKH